MEHGYFGDEDCLRYLAQTGAVWVPTLAATAGFAGREGFGPGVAEENIRSQGRMLRKAAEMGVLIAAGSDAGAYGVPPDTGIHLEHALLAAAGIPAGIVRAGDEAIRQRFRRD